LDVLGHFKTKCLVPEGKFNDSFAPMMNDVSFLKLCELKTRIIDVETAFLYRDLTLEIFVQITPRLKQQRMFEEGNL
jgi:hypothetical protein